MPVKEKKQLIPKRYKCPHCGEDLRKHGFTSYEPAYVEYNWKWGKEKESKISFFHSHEVGVDEAIDNDLASPSAECGNCGEDIWSFVRDNDLI